LDRDAIPFKVNVFREFGSWTVFVQVGMAKMRMKKKSLFRELKRQWRKNEVLQSHTLETDA
jgi:hypothetical protein